MSQRTKSCRTCYHSQWVVPNVNCGKCKRFNKWEKTKKRNKPKPIYIGHREGE